MNLKLQNGVCQRPSSRASLGDINALLAHDDTEQAKRLKDEATSILHERYAKLAGMNGVDISKQEITELCISTTFLLLILRCRLLANLLASLSTFDDKDRVPDMPWDSQQQSTLGRLDGGFYSYYLWRREWFDVVDRWQQAEDSIWLGAKVSGMRNQDWTRRFQLAKSPVLLILVAAMSFTIYSTILCEAPDALPVVDSNFWSTLSQCVSGFAGLYVVTNSMFSGKEKDKIKTAFPKTFYTMLVLSLATSIVSAVAYAWSPRASIPLGYVSGLTLNIATLLIIQDSGNQIKETNELNEKLVRELAGYRARR